MADHVAQDTEKLYRDIRILREKIRDFREKARRTYEEAEVLNGCWEGPAREDFVKAFQKDYEHCMNFCGYLEKVIGLYQDAARSYDACETEVADLVSRIRI